MTLASLISAYLDAEPRLGIWRRWPDVTEAENDYTDRWACESVSAEFTAFARAWGFNAFTVHADDAEHPMHTDHYWTRIGGIDIDFTARQFYNLEDPPRREHADLPCPLVWVANGAHPISGQYRAVAVA